MADAELTSESAEQALNSLSLLSGLAPEVRELVVASFVPVRYDFGETIVAAGDRPDGFYLLLSGTARVLAVADDGTEVSLNLLHEHDSFGEVGLLDGSPRTETVRAASEVRALRLDETVVSALARLHPSIRTALELQEGARRLADFLRVHSAFSRLPDEAVAPMLSALERVELEAGEHAIREGDPPGALFIVEHGRLHAFRGQDQAHHDTGYLRSGDIFGERALYRGARHEATVQALERCQLLRLDHSDFSALMAQHEEFRQRVEELVALEEHRRTPQVPLDFAELLPAHASEAAIVERGPDEDHVARGATLSELPGADAAALPPEPGVEGQARSRPRRWRRRPKFPLVRQLDETDCGAACVAMVCRHFGRDVALSHIRMAVGTGADGTSLRGVQRGGEHLGLEVRTIKASKERVHELPCPRSSTGAGTTGSCSTGSRGIASMWPTRRGDSGAWAGTS